MVAGSVLEGYKLLPVGSNPLTNMRCTPYSGLCTECGPLIDAATRSAGAIDAALLVTTE